MRKHHEAIKEWEREMKEEKEAERNVSHAFAAVGELMKKGRLTLLQAFVQRIKDRRAAKEEKERYEKMAEKVHSKRVERLKRKEKRNKLLHS